MVKSTFRADIDCLRGVAVLLVVAFHLGVYPFSGGFVGVDIFFVISGFLITRMVTAETGAGDFSFVRFYERRVRRIIPALYVVVAVTCVASLFYLLPDEQERFSKSVLAVITFVSNILFWQEAGYFAPAAYEKPLLHIWSLAVEEQFYFVFPALIYLVARFDRRREFLWICVAAALSFAVGVWGIRHAFSATFYLAPPRAWEFLVGAMLAIPGIPAPKHQWHRAVALVIGIGLIAAAVLLLGNGSRFPGEKALAPCLGAGLLIWAFTGSESRTPQNVAARLLLFFGTISYSLYLWHWPVMLFYQRIAQTANRPAMLAVLDRTVIIAVSIALAYASYRWIESPVRRRTVFATRRSLFLGAAVASLALAAFGGAGLRWHGFPERFDPKLAAFAQAGAVPAFEAYEINRCFMYTGHGFAELQPGCLSATPGKTNILVWGDSTAAHYVHGIRKFAGDNVQVSHATASLCPPVYGLDFEGVPECRGFNDGVRAFIQSAHPDAVVMASVWNWFIDAEGYDRAVAAIRQTAAAIAKDSTVFILGPPVQYTDTLPHLVMLYGDAAGRSFNFDRFLDPDVSAVDKRLKAEFSAMPRVHYISMADLICEGGHCPVLLNGNILMQWDNMHLSAPGSEPAAQKLMPKLLPLIGKAGERPN